MKQKDNKKYLIIGLCAIVVLMAVGYAAFAQMLQINGTSQITSNWCVGFDNTKTNTMTKTAGISGGTEPTGTITYGGSSCGTKSETSVDLSATFKQPGDSIEYTLTILNEGSLDAVIDEIKVGDSTITSDTTFTRGNVKFQIKMPSSLNVAAGSSTIMKVVATFQNDTDITQSYGGEHQEISVSINASQDTGSGGMVVENDIYVYRWSTSQWTANQDISGMTEGTDYVTSASAVTNMNVRGANYYLKYKIENNIATESYVCFVTDAEHCLRSGDGAAYTDNVSELTGQQSWFTGHGGSCTLQPSGSSSSCYGGPFSNVIAASSGSVGAYDDDDGYCDVNSDGSSYCVEATGGGR